MSPSTPGTCPLTPRELEVVAAVGEGLTYKQATLRFNCAESTVRNHMHSSCAKLGAPNGAQAFLICVRSGWVDLDRDENPSEAAQLVRLERLLATIGSAIRRRHEQDLTLVQRRYLDAFEEHLFAEGQAAIRVTADRMSVAFSAMCAEAGINIERNVRQKLGAGQERKVA